MVFANPWRMPPIVFKSKIKKEMKSTNTELKNAAVEQAAPSENNKTKPPEKKNKNAKTAVPNAQVAKMLVGDEIARVANRCEPILGNRTPEIGEMIAEKLSDQIDGLKAGLVVLVAEIDRESTPGNLARQWVEWREAKARAKEEELEKRKLEAAAKALAKTEAGQPDGVRTQDAKPVTPSFPGTSPADAEKPLATATGQIGL